MKMLFLGLHFLLELAAMAALAVWGFTAGENLLQKILLGIGVPVIAAALWGIFRVPNDPGPATVAIPGPLRLLLELVVLLGAAADLYAANHLTLALVFVGLVVLDYLMMLDRVGRLIRG